MRIRIGNRVLRAAVEAVRSAAGSPINDSVVSNIYLAARDGVMTSAATNLVLAIRYTAECVVEEPGGVLLDSGTLAEVARDMPEGEVEIAVDGKNTARIVCGKFRARIGGVDPDLFPLFPSVDRAMEFYEASAEGKDLREALSRGILALASEREKARYQVDGVQISLREGRLRLATTDGRRLSVWDDVDGVVKIEGAPETLERVIAPGKSMLDVMRLLPKEGEARLAVGERKMEIGAGPVVVVSNLLGGAFPDVDRIIPPPGEESATCQREELEGAVNRVSALTDRETCRVSLRFGEEAKRLILKGEQDALGGEARDDVSCDYEGPPLEIRFNYKFLLDFLRGVDCSSVKMEWRKKKDGETGPVVFRGVGEEGHQYVLMPMRQAEK